MFRTDSAFSGSRIPTPKKAGGRRRRRVLPSRLRSSKKKYSITREISKQINNMSENKFQGYTGDCLIPVAKPAGAQPIKYIFLNTGEQLNQPANSPFVPMNLYSFPVGSTGQERNGDYMYLKKTHIKMEVQMLPTIGTDATSLNSTTEFRLMIIKANRKLNKLGVSPIPGESLFIDTQNDKFGFGVPGGASTATSFLNQHQPINKRQWLVYKDMRFTLSTPAQELTDSAPAPQHAINTSNSKYPVKKFISCDLPIWKKTHFGGNVPDNVDTQFLMILSAMPTNHCTTSVRAPENFRMNITGTTSASDN